MDNKCNAGQTVEQYIACAPQEEIERLQDIHNFIFSIAPNAVGGIGSKMLSYKLCGRQFAYLAAQRGYIGFYVDAKSVEMLSEKLVGFTGSKAGIHLPNDRPIPYDILREMLQIRMETIKLKNKK